MTSVEQKRRYYEEWWYPALDTIDFIYIDL